MNDSIVESPIVVFFIHGSRFQQSLTISLSSASNESNAMRNQMRRVRLPICMNRNESHSLGFALL